MKQQTKDFINKIKDKMKDPITKRKKYSNGDAVLDDAIAYYYEELKHSKQLWGNVGTLFFRYYWPPEVTKRESDGKRMIQSHGNKKNSENFRRNFRIF